MLPSPNVRKRAIAFATTLCILPLAAGCNFNVKPSQPNLFAGTWSCSLDRSTLADGGDVTSTVTFRFVRNGDGTVTSTELDDAGALPCAIQYVDPGPDLQVSTGQTCTFDGVAYKLGGAVQATSATMSMDLWYYNGAPSDPVTGDINANCTH